MEQLSLYPFTAGHKAKSGPSLEAAIGVTGSSKRLATMAKICASLRDDGPATADELAKRLDLDKLYVRPRVFELHTVRKVYDTGARRENESGRTATVWGLCKRIGDTPDQPHQKARPRLRVVASDGQRRESEPELALEPVAKLPGLLATLRSAFRSMLGGWRR